MDRAISALQEDDVELIDEVLDKVVADVDSPGRRIELAQAVLTLRDEGRIPSELAAAAVLELDGKESTLFLSSVAASLAVLAGDRGGCARWDPRSHPIGPLQVQPPAPRSPTYLARALSLRLNP